MSGPAYTLSDLALNGLLVCSESDIRRLIGAFEQLALDPDMPGLFAFKDDVGRLLHQLRSGRFVIIFYPQQGELPLYIVDLRRI